MAYMRRVPQETSLYKAVSQYFDPFVNDLEAAGFCKECSLNTLIEGASSCCAQAGTYLSNDQCFPCPQPKSMPE